jgi:hypothetical protein
MRRFVAFSGLAATGILTLIAGSITGCAPDTSAPVLQSRLTAPPNPAPTEVVMVAQAEATPDILVFEDTACLDCHTDQTRLTELAQPVEETESLSSGPG